MKYFAVSIELTNHCNYRCVLCPHAYYRSASHQGNPFDRPKGFLSSQIWEEALRAAARLKIDLIIGFFGEPLLHPQLTDFLTAIPAKRNFKVHLNSNWSLFTNAYIDAFTNIDSVRVSLDTTVPALYDRLSPGGAVLEMDGRVSSRRLETVEKKLQTWLSLKKRPSTRIVVVRSSYNGEDIEPLVRKWQPFLHRDDHLIVKSVISYGGCISNPEISANPCDIHEVPWINIAHDGRVSPCNLDVNMALAAGSLSRECRLEDILSSSKWEQVLESIRAKRGICANCLDANNWTKNTMYAALEVRDAAQD